MARKYGIISAVVLCAVFVLAVATNLSLTQKGADIYTKKFHFLGVFNSELVPTEEELDAAIEDADLILIVRPMDEIETYAYSVLQKVKITKVVKGSEEVSNEIWISSTNGVYNGDNWGVANLMYSDYEYMVFLDEMDGQYFDEFYLGSIRLDDKQTWNLIDVSKEYTYAELKAEKYFAEDVETLETLYAREKYVIEKINNF